MCGEYENNNHDDARSSLTLYLPQADISVAVGTLAPGTVQTNGVTVRVTVTLPVSGTLPDVISNHLNGYLAHRDRRRRPDHIRVRGHDVLELMRSRRSPI